MDYEVAFGLVGVAVLFTLGVVAYCDRLDMLTRIQRLEKKARKSNVRRK